MAFSTSRAPRAAGLPSNPRAQLMKPSNSTPNLVPRQTLSLIEPRSHNVNHTRPTKIEEPNEVVLARGDPSREVSNISLDGPPGPSESSFWTKVNLPFLQNDNDSKDILATHPKEQVMTKSNDNNLIGSRISEAATALTQEVSKVWLLKISPIGISSNQEEESDLTEVMRAYHLSKARQPSDLPAWLFSDTERGESGLFSSRNK